MDRMNEEQLSVFAEKLVDAIGEKLGVDTGSISEARFLEAVEAARTVIREGMPDAIIQPRAPAKDVPETPECDTLPYD
jgi:hypothetical protein